MRDDNTSFVSSLFKLRYWGEQYPPIYVHPEPQNVTFFGNRLFADAISQDESKPDLSDPKSQQWPQDWKRSVFIPIPKKGNAKECSNYCTMHSSHMLVK